MSSDIKNTAASVHQRLLNKAKESSRPFNELLQRFAIERFIYRLSKSPHADQFILKGALMFSVWSGSGSRSTMDIDFLGRIDNSLGGIAAAMKDFYDIWMLSREFDFKGKILAEAIEKTFEKRNTPITIAPTVFNPSFVKDGDKKVQWQGFIRKAKLANPPEAFEDVVDAIKLFLGPLIASLAERRAFRRIWSAPGPWR